MGVEIMKIKCGFHAVLIAMTVCITQVITEDCGQEELVQCSRPLQMLTATSELSFVTKKEELDKLCPDLHAGLHCIRSYTRRCMNIHQREHFNKLYHGTNQMIHELCEEGPYQEDFLRHAPCMRHVKKEYEVCASRYQITIAKIGQSMATTTTTVRPYYHSAYTITTTMMPLTLNGDLQEKQENSTLNKSDEEDHIKKICCAFHKYIHCSEHTVRRSCGEETAMFTRKFLDKMTGTIMRMHCENYGPSTGKCKDFSSKSTISIASNVTIIAELVIVLLYAKFLFITC